MAVCLVDSMAALWAVLTVAVMVVTMAAYLVDYWAVLTAAPTVWKSAVLSVGCSVG